MPELPDVDSAAFLAHAERVRAEYLGLDLSESDTREFLIDRVLRMLGYTRPADVRREARVRESGSLVDYALFVGGKPYAIIEAKRIRHSVRAEDAAQCLQYAAVFGGRWCMITNGVIWDLYDARGDRPLAEKRVATARLDQDEAATLAAWQVIRVLARDPAIAAGARQAVFVRSVIASDLANPDSEAVRALTRSLQARFGETVTGPAIVEALTERADNPRATPPQPPAPQQGEPLLAQTNVNTPLAELVRAGLLAPDAALEFRLGAKVQPGWMRDGQIEWAGQRFKTPSGALKAITGAAGNGWLHWYVGEVSLDTLRQQWRAGAGEASGTGA